MGAGKGASRSVAWSGAVQFVTISLVILASYNVSFLIESTTAILFGFRWVLHQKLQLTPPHADSAQS